MKKALVLAIVCALGLGVGAFAGPMSGFWYTNIVLDLTPTPPATMLYSFTSILNIGYAVAGWDFGSTTVFLQSGIFDQYFVVHGMLGAFTIGSYLNFNPTTELFEQWLSGLKVNIAGVSLYGFFDLAQCDTHVQTAVGTAWLFGVEGGAGDLTFRGEVYGNLVSSLLIQGYTFDDIVGGFADPAYAFDPIHGCFSISIAEDAFTLESCSDCFCFSGADLQVTFPFACIETVQLRAVFTDDGFHYFRMDLNDIALGVDWLSIDDFDLRWHAGIKEMLRLDMDIKLTSACLTPYFVLNPDVLYGDSGFNIDEIELYALGLTYSFNGVTFKSITLFDELNYALTWGGAPVRIDIAIDTLPYYTYCINEYDEMFQIIVDSDACCGGAFGFTVTNWFDISDDEGGELFGWQETDINFSIGIGSNFTLTTMLVIDTTSVQLWGMGFTVSW